MKTLIRRAHKESSGLEFYENCLIKVIWILTSQDSQLIATVLLSAKRSSDHFRDIAEDEVDHLFGSSDDDNDGVLDFAEILTHHDIFVGSEATDYGEHLQNLDRFDDEL